MNIKIAWIGKTKAPAIASLTEEYLKRISRYVPVEGLSLRDEAALLDTCGRSATRTASACVSPATATNGLLSPVAAAA